MSKQVDAVTVLIMGKEYKIACADDEKEALLDSARELDKQMREIRDSGKVTSPDRIAVLAALNLSHELNQVQSMVASPAQGVVDKLHELRLKIEEALSG